MALFKQGIKLAVLALFLQQSALVRAESPAVLTGIQTARLNQLVDNANSEYGIVGHTVMVLANGKLAYSRSQGLVSLDSQSRVTNNTIYPIYSVTKLYVSAMLLRLIEQGKLEASQPVSHYLDDLPDNWRSIKVSSLMAHSSGLPEFFDLSQKTSEDPKAIIRSLRDKPFAFQTNTNIRYNQTNFLLLKLIIEKFYGKSLIDVIDSEIIKPYSLNHTVYGGGNVTVPGRSTHYYIRDKGEISDFGVWPFATTMYAATGLNTSGVDIARWFEVLVSGEFVKPQTLLSAWQPFKLTTGRTATYSHGWQVQAEPQATAVGHYGGNIINARHFYINDNPSQSVTVLHLTNGGFHPSFNAFEFSYALANTVNAEIKMDSVELAQRLLSQAENNQLEQMAQSYFAFRQHPNTQQIPTENLINNLGYQLLDTIPVAALKLFELNTMSYPESANAYDSYAEALYHVGEYSKSKANYQKALDLDSSYQHIPDRIREIDAKQSLMD